MIETPTLVPPTGGGYMPLSAAAYWIATRGGSVTFDLNDPEAWRPAYEALRARLSSGDVRAMGMRGEERLEIPAVEFAGIRFVLPACLTEDFMVIFTAEFSLVCWPYNDEYRWLRGESDTIENCTIKRWSRVMVRNEDIEKFWPAEPRKPLTTGLPGRPTTRHVYEPEFERRIAAEEIEKSLAGEAHYLRGWVKTNHPEYPVPVERRAAGLTIDRPPADNRELGEPLRRTGKPVGGLDVAGGNSPTHVPHGSGHRGSLEGHDQVLVQSRHAREWRGGEVEASRAMKKRPQMPAKRSFRRLAVGTNEINSKTMRPSVEQKFRPLGRIGDRRPRHASRPSTRASADGVGASGVPGPVQRSARRPGRLRTVRHLYRSFASESGVTAEAGRDPIDPHRLNRRLEGVSAGRRAGLAAENRPHAHPAECRPECWPTGRPSRRDLDAV